MDSCDYNFGPFGNADESAASDELLAIGPVSAFLVKGPTATFWRYRYPRYGNFVMLSVAKQLNPAPVFGGTSSVKLSDITGDLMYYLYAVIELPGIHARRTSRHSSRNNTSFPSADRHVISSADRRAYHKIGAEYANPRDCDNLTEIGYGEAGLRDYGELRRLPDNASSCDTSAFGGSAASSNSSNSCRRPWAYWTNASGQLAVKRAWLMVGGYLADTLYSDYLYMWEELSGKAGKRLREMIGKRRTPAQLKRASASTQRLYVPLPFYFTLTSGSAFAMCATERDVDLYIQFEALEHCIVRSSHDVAVINSRTNKPIVSGDLKAWVDVTNVYLSTPERLKFAAGNFDQLMTQVQYNTTSHTSGPTVNNQLNFKHPAIEIITAVRRRARELTNQWFNYSGVGSRDPVDWMALRLDGKLRTAKPGVYYRTVTCRETHSNIPKGFIYVLPFALNCESENPSGGSILGGIYNKVELFMSLQRGLDTETVNVLTFQRGYNVMRFKKFNAGVLYL